MKIGVPVALRFLGRNVYAGGGIEIMKKPLVILMGLVCFFSFSSWGIPILLNSPVNGNPANPEQELARLQAAIHSYNSANPTPLPDAWSLDSSPYIIPGGELENYQVQTKSSPTSLTIDFSWERVNYLMLKFGDQNLFYYVGNEMGPVIFENNLILNKKGKPLGLSHYNLFDPVTPTPLKASSTTTIIDVPEVGGTVLLLFIGIICLFGFGKAWLSTE